MDRRSRPRTSSAGSQSKVAGHVLRAEKTLESREGEEGAWWAACGERGSRFVRKTYGAIMLMRCGRGRAAAGGGPAR